MEQINMDHVENSVAEKMEKTLKVKLNPEERQKCNLLARRIILLMKFLNNVDSINSDCFSLK